MNELTKQEQDKLTKAIKQAVEELKLDNLKATETNTFRVVATDATTDRDGEVVKVEGWDFSNYLKSPVVFADHASWSIYNIAGKVTNIYVVDGQVVAEGIFTDATEAGKIANSLYQSGFLKAVSVGFLIKARNAVDQNIIDSAELMELSFVGIPCNPNAVSLDEKTFKKGVELGLIKEVEDEDDNDKEEKEVTSKDIYNLFGELKTILTDISDKLNGTSKEEDKSIDFSNKEFLQELNRSISEQLRMNKKTV